ncbi:MAG: hypothetical protein O3B87_03270 [bacterium]|nr:hypothetical protein [bacterium]
MGAKQILKQIDTSQWVLKLGKDTFTIEAKASDVKKGLPVNELIKEIDKASKENLLSNEDIF